jgi:hypothetical protein
MDLGLRQRTPPVTPKAAEAAATTTPTNEDMTYGRRNFIAYQRTGVLPSTVIPSRSLTHYRNKTILILIITCAYTAFLYQRGQ